MSRSAFSAPLRARTTAASISLRSSTASVSPARTARPSSTKIRLTTPPTLKLSGTSSLAPSVPGAVAEGAIRSTLTEATRTATASPAGGAAARPRVHAASVSDSNTIIGVRYMCSAPLSGRDLAERSSALQFDPANRVAVRGEDTVQLRVRVSSACIDELDGSGDPFFVTTSHQLEGAARRFEARVGRGDRRAGHDGGFVRRPHLERDPVRQVLPLGAGAIRIVAGFGFSGRVATAVEEVPRHDDRREPEIVARPERDIGPLAPVVQRPGSAGTAGR